MPLNFNWKKRVFQAQPLAQITLEESQFLLSKDDDGFLFSERLVWGGLTGDYFESENTDMLKTAFAVAAQHKMEI